MIRRQNSIDLESEDEDDDNYFRFVDETEDHHFVDDIDEMNHETMITPPTNMNHLNGVDDVRRPNLRDLRNPNRMNNDHNDDDDSDDMNNTTMMNLLSTFRHNNNSQRTLLPVTPPPSATTASRSLVSSTNSGHDVLLILKPLYFSGLRRSNYCLLPPSFSCCIEIDGIKRKVPIYHNASTTAAATVAVVNADVTTIINDEKSRKEIKLQTKECMWELFDYYGPLTVQIQIFQHFLFAKKLVGSYEVDLKSFNTMSMIDISSSSSSSTATPVAATTTINTTHNTPSSSSSSLVFPAGIPLSSFTTNLRKIESSCPLKHTRMMAIPKNNCSSWMIGEHSLCWGDLSFSKLMNNSKSNNHHHHHHFNDDNNHENDDHFNTNNNTNSNNPKNASTIIAASNQYSSTSTLYLNIEYNLIFVKHCLILRRLDAFYTPHHQCEYHHSGSHHHHHHHHQSTPSSEVYMTVNTTAPTMLTTSTNPIDSSSSLSSSSSSSYSPSVVQSNNIIRGTTPSNISNSNNTTTSSIFALPNTTSNTTSISTMVATPLVSLNHCMSVTTMSEDIAINDFHLMAAYGSVHIINQILYISSRNQSLRSLLSIRDTHHRNALDIALLHGNVPIVKTLLRRSGHLCFQNIDSPHINSPVHNAIQGGNFECVKIVLLFLKKNIQAVYQHSEFPVLSPFMLPIRMDPDIPPHTKRAMFRSVLETRGENGNTALTLACLLIQPSSSSSSSLLQQQSHQQRQQHIKTPNHPLYCSSSSSFSPSLTAHYLKPPSSTQYNPQISDRTIRLLIMLGAESACVNNDMKTPLMIACERGRLQIVDLLLSKHTPNYDDVAYNNNSTIITTIHSSGLNSISASHANSSNRHTNIRYAAGPWLKDDDGNTCLMLAVINQHIDVVRYLSINHRLGSVFDKNKNGDNIFHLLARGTDNNESCSSSNCNTNSINTNNSNNITVTHNNYNNNNTTANHPNNTNGTTSNQCHDELLSYFKTLEQKQWQAYLTSTTIHSTFTTMCPGSKMLIAMNHQGKRPIDIAVEKGHMEIAFKLYTMAVEIYDEKRGSGDDNEDEKRGSCDDNHNNDDDDQVIHNTANGHGNSSMNIYTNTVNTNTTVNNNKNKNNNSNNNCKISSNSNNTNNRNNSNSIISMKHNNRDTMMKAKNWELLVQYVNKMSQSSEEEVEGNVKRSRAEETVATVAIQESIDDTTNNCNNHDNNNDNNDIKQVNNNGIITTNNNNNNNNSNSNNVDSSNSNHENSSRGVGDFPITSAVSSSNTRKNNSSFIDRIRRFILQKSSSSSLGNNINNKKLNNNSNSNNNDSNSNNHHIMLGLGKKMNGGDKTGLNSEINNNKTRVAMMAMMTSSTAVTLTSGETHYKINKSNNNDDDDDGDVMETYDERNYADKLAYDTALTYNDNGNLMYLGLTEPPEAYRQGLSADTDTKKKNKKEDEKEGEEEEEVKEEEEEEKEEIEGEKRTTIPYQSVMIISSNKS